MTLWFHWFLVEIHCSASCLSSGRSTQPWKDIMAFSNVVKTLKEVWWNCLFIARHRTQISMIFESTSNILYFDLCFYTVCFLLLSHCHLNMKTERDFKHFQTLSLWAIKLFSIHIEVKRYKHDQFNNTN